LTTKEHEELLERLRSKRSLPPPNERRRIRLKAGATLRDVGDALGVSHSLVRHWETKGTPRARLRAPYGALLDELRLIGFSKGKGGRP
jgi:DNA-binding transcriptional regulator YiaG